MQSTILPNTRAARLVYGKIPHAILPNTTFLFSEKGKPCYKEELFKNGSYLNMASVVYPQNQWTSPTAWPTKMNVIGGAVQFSFSSLAKSICVVTVKKSNLLTTVKRLTSPLSFSNQIIVTITCIRHDLLLM